MDLKKRNEGIEIWHQSCQVFFGNRHVGLREIALNYPGLKLTQIQQIHGNKIVEAIDSDIPIADGIWTNTTNQALVISTADCLPIFFYHQQLSWVCAIHAGWRGIAQGIVLRALEMAKAKNILLQELSIFIGPHIHRKSFEVGNDVRDNILQSLNRYSESQKFFDPLSKEKSLLDLNLVVCQQMEMHGISARQIVNINIDTFTDSDCFSFRRDKGSGRNYSFIALVHTC